VKRTKTDDVTMKLFITPFGENKFACRLDGKYKPNTDEKELAFIVALGLRQISLDDPDLIYSLGKSLYEVLEMESENGKDNIIYLDEWKKKLH
tara:strand:- start:134 stop:412 length:279 start_codon:yes stop_codon:yes gene_type:complete